MKNRICLYISLASILFNLILAGELAATNSAFKRTGYTATITLGHQAADPRLEQLAAAINPRQLRMK